MKKQLAAALLLACAPFAASARDSLGSFTYVEGGFQGLSVDFGTPGSDSLDFNGLGVHASKELSDNFYIYGGYGWSKNSDLDTSVYARQMQAGLGYRYTVFDNADLITDVGFQHTKSTALAVVTTASTQRVSRWACAVRWATASRPG